MNINTPYNKKLDQINYHSLKKKQAEKELKKILDVIYLINETNNNKLASSYSHNNKQYIIEMPILLQNDVYIRPTD